MIIRSWKYKMLSQISNFKFKKEINRMIISNKSTIFMKMVGCKKLKMRFKVELRLVKKVASLLQQQLALHLLDKNQISKWREKIWKNLGQSWILSSSKTQAQSRRATRISLKVLKKEDHYLVIRLLINLGLKLIN